MIYGKFVQTVPNCTEYQDTFGLFENSFSNVFSILDENHLFSDSAYVSIQEKYDMLLEGVIGDIFNAIGEAIKKFIEWIKSFFTKAQKKIEEKDKKFKKPGSKYSDEVIKASVDDAEEFINREENKIPYLVLEKNFTSFILDENPTMNTDFIGKIFNIINSGYKEKLDLDREQILLEGKKAMLQILNSDIQKQIDWSNAEESLEEIFDKLPCESIEFENCDVKSLLTKLSDKCTKGFSSKKFNYKKLESVITKFGDNISDILNKMKSDFNKFIKQTHPDNHINDSEKDKEFNQNYMTLMVAMKDFFKEMSGNIKDLLLMLERSESMNLTNINGLIHILDSHNKEKKANS